MFKSRGKNKRISSSYYHLYNSLYQLSYLTHEMNDIHVDLTEGYIWYWHCSRMHDIHDDHRKKLKEVILEPLRPIFKRLHSTYRTVINWYPKISIVDLRNIPLVIGIRASIIRWNRAIVAWWLMTRIRFGE